MTTTALLPVPIFRAFNSAGDPLAGGLLYTYLANTTTNATTWSDAAGSTPNANPVVLDSTGSATVRLDPTISYKFVLKDSGGTTQWTEDYYQNNYLTAAQIGQILYPQTTAEIAASVTPTSYGYPGDPIIDPRRYHVVGTIGTAADDLSSVNTAISVLKQVGNGATIIVPGSYSKSMTLPALGLSASQSGTIVDYRTNLTSPFGSTQTYTEARDSGGAYASEFGIKGKQNPAVVLQTLSDGTAPSYTYPGANNATSFLARTNASASNFQLLTDPNFQGLTGHVSINLWPSGTFSATDIAPDANNKNRWNFQTNRFSTSAINISGVTAASPPVVTTASPHNVNTGQYFSVTIAGTSTSIDGTWLANATGASTFSLLNLTSVGVIGAVGTATVRRSYGRAIINVPVVQGGTESVYAEGSFVISAATNAQGFIVHDTTGTQLGGFLYNSTSGVCGIKGLKGISQSNTQANNLAGTGSFSAATTATVTFANNESNANYRVFVTLTSDAGVQTKPPWVSGKGTTGFTVNLQAAGSPTFDWMIIRD